MKPDIVTIPTKKLIGMYRRMALASGETASLWREFMPRRNEIKNRVDSKYYSMNVYDEDMDFSHVTAATEITKWAAVEVSEFEDVPVGMSRYIMKAGRYAVFIHKGPAKDFEKTWNYIHFEWLPNSEYVLDNREHYEILDEGYDPNDTNAQEQVWVPIKSK